MRKLLTVILLLLSLRLAAQDTVPAPAVCPLTSTYGVEIGAARNFNTYLSPIRHTGTHMGVYGQWGRAIGFDPERWFGMGSARYGMDFCQNPQGTSSMTNIDLTGDWALYRKLRPLPGLVAAFGAGAELDAGLLYLPRNSNNPVAARVSLSLTLNAYGAYDLRIGRLPVRIIDQVSLPSLSVFFSPQYGESYYEIYLGDHSGLARCGWWGNHFAIANTLAAEFSVFSVRWRLSYRFDLRSSYVSHINTRLVSHSIGIGITTDWLNITRGHNASARLIPMIDP